MEFLQSNMGVGFGGELIYIQHVFLIILIHLLYIPATFEMKKNLLHNFNEFTKWHMKAQSTSFTVTTHKYKELLLLRNKVQYRDLYSKLPLPHGYGWNEMSLAAD